MGCSLSEYAITLVPRHVDYVFVRPLGFRHSGSGLRVVGAANPTRVCYCQLSPPRRLMSSCCYLRISISRTRRRRRVSAHLTLAIHIGVSTHGKAAHDDRRLLALTFRLAKPGSHRVLGQGVETSKSSQPQTVIGMSLGSTGMRWKPSFELSFCSLRGHSSQRLPAIQGAKVIKVRGAPQKRVSYFGCQRCVKESLGCMGSGFAVAICIIL